MSDPGSGDLFKVYDEGDDVPDHMIKKGEPSPRPDGEASPHDGQPARPARRGDR